jgi:hypothetical protein
MGQESTLATDAVPCADHDTVDPDSVPLAEPDTLRSPLHVALKVPLAELPDCCVTFHLKSVQASATDVRLAELQVPRRAAAPVAEGESVLCRS